MPDEIKVINKNNPYFTVTKDVEVVLDNKKFMLEAGDKVVLQKPANQPKK